MAELDHMDGMETLPALPDGGEAADVEEPERNLQMMPDGEEDSSDEEAEEAEDTPMASEAEGPRQVAVRKRQRLYPPPPAPGAKRLNGKQRPPAAYLTAGIALPAEKVLKRPAMRKRPAAARSPYPNEQCQGYRGTACRFNPQRPGEAGRVQPSREVYHCMFCKADRLQEAHAGRRHGGPTASQGRWVEP